MSVTQNEKIRQVTETTMVIGVDIANVGFDSALK